MKALIQTIITRIVTSSQQFVAFLALLGRYIISALKGFVNVVARIDLYIGSVLKGFVNVVAMIGLGIGIVISGLFVAVLLMINRPAVSVSTQSEPQVRQAIRQFAQRVIQQIDDEDATTYDGVRVTITGTSYALDAVTAELQELADSATWLEIKKISRAPATADIGATVQLVLAGPWDHIIDSMGPRWHGHEIYSVHVDPDSAAA